MRKRVTAILAAVALAGGVAACGGEDSAEPQSVPAAGENTPPSGTPGVPEGAPYDVDGGEWIGLSRSEQFDAARAYIEDNPARCEAADPAGVAIYVTNSYGLDFPAYVPASEVLAEGCDAERQS